ncbi:MAG TPA: hypothetical protein VEJ37_02300 [Xanthobacteraceae bacterium]|nr:hypothetical protein [Xanthobacteraceae bacterium]
MQTLIFRPRAIVMTEGRIRRKPVRPPAYRQPGFAEQFDYDTLIFDAFFYRRNEVLLTAPPFLNLLPLLRKMTITAAPSGQRCEFRIRTLDRHGQIQIDVPAQTKSLVVSSELGQFQIEPQANYCDFFAGGRVLFTLSKNNRLEWIQDWIRYHRDIHGATGVLIYDNKSTTYSQQDLLGAISEIAGIDRACVVDWPFRYGPQGLDAKRFWDSDFCQCGAWEHARWAFLQRARSAMNGDVDELVISEDGSSVFEAAERSRLGIVRYRGHWVHGFKDRTRVASEQSPVRVVDFDHYLRHSVRRRWGLIPVHADACPPKWTIVPSRCPQGAQWSAHRIKGWAKSFLLERNFSFRHFREIGDGWKYDRSLRETFNPERYAFDRVLRANFAAVQWTV